jgi:hypothetical protein
VIAFTGTQPELLESLSVPAAAVRWGWIISNPAEAANKPRKPAAVPDPPSTADAARIVDAAWKISPDWGMFV